jgi:hypothetical protein
MRTVLCLGRKCGQALRNKIPCPRVLITHRCFLASHVLILTSLFSEIVEQVTFISASLNNFPIINTIQNHFILFVACNRKRSCIILKRNMKYVVRLNGELIHNLILMLACI